MFRLAEALEADDRGNVFVADTRNDRVQACDYNGSCVAFGDFGSGPGQFFRPVGLAIDGQARLYVAGLIAQRSVRVSLSRSSKTSA
jgi:sugar lactone lactonase YvrE